MRRETRPLALGMLVQLRGKPTDGSGRVVANDEGSSSAAPGVGGGLAGALVTHRSRTRLGPRRCRLSAAAGPEQLGEAEAIRTPCTLTTKTINSVGLSADLVSLIRRRGSVLGFPGEAEDFTLARHCGGLERSCTEVLQKWRYLMQH